MDVDYARLQTALVPGERVIWSGRPDPASLFTTGDFFLVPFSVFTSVFIGYWDWAAFQPSTPLVFKLAGIFFGGFAVYNLIGRFFVKRWDHAQTLYAITASRAIVMRGRSATERPILRQALETKIASNGRHMSLRVGSPDAPWYRRNSQSEVYLNTGMDFFFVRSDGTVRFFDVADVAGLTAAIAEIRVLSAK